MTEPTIKQHPTRSGVWRLTTELTLPRPIEEVFTFFAEAGNLEEITPRWLEFQVETPAPIEMRAGRLIDYRLRVHGIPIRWQSEISAWEPPYRFVDEQRTGPYRLWHHEHTFVECEEGTLVGDQVDYAVPGGRLVHALVVRRDLRKIFRYRTQKLREILGVDDGSKTPATTATAEPVGTE
jgi:ligand-binding SRPBCC domain-containing protein